MAFASFPLPPVTPIIESQNTGLLKPYAMLCPFFFDDISPMRESYQCLYTVKQRRSQCKKKLILPLS